MKPQGRGLKMWLRDVHSDIYGQRVKLGDDVGEKGRTFLVQVAG